MNQRKQLEQQLIEKAMKDESFRKQLIENPKEIIEAEFGRKIPESIKINVLVEDAQTVYLILPQFSTQNSEVELTDAELKAVTGGTIWSWEECDSFLEKRN